jgi:hypothetical protein
MICVSAALGGAHFGGHWHGVSEVLLEKREIKTMDCS